MQSACPHALMWRGLRLCSRLTKRYDCTLQTSQHTHEVWNTLAMQEEEEEYLDPVFGCLHESQKLCCRVSDMDESRGHTKEEKWMKPSLEEFVNEKVNLWPITMQFVSSLLTLSEWKACPELSLLEWANVTWQWVYLTRCMNSKNDTQIAKSSVLNHQAYQINHAI